MAIRYALVETSFGCAGIAWTADGICRVQIPGGGAEAVRSRLTRGLAGALEARPDAWGERAGVALQAYFAGVAVDFSHLALDHGCLDPFRVSIWQAAARIPYGETSTYGALAEAAGYKGHAREAGQALGSNPLPIVVPCHRVVAADGRLGGFSAPGGSSTKARLLALEKARPPSEQNGLQGRLAF